MVLTATMPLYRSGDLRPNRSGETNLSNVNRAGSLVA